VNILKFTQAGIFAGLIVARCAVYGTLFARLQADRTSREGERKMIGVTRAIGTLVGAAMVILSFAMPAHSQGLGLHNRPGNGGYDPTPPGGKTEKVDEKAYKSAIDRIPEPTQKYDPWGAARPAEPEKTKKKSN
jgi:hypothetical protein